MRKQQTVIINGNKNYVSRWKILAVVLMIAVIVINVYYRVKIKIINDEFAEQINEYAKLNQTTIFSIDGIYMYSSAGALDNTDVNPVWNLNLYQFTDIAMYINNRSDEELTYENSIRSMYISDVKFNNVKLGEQSLHYKNVNDFGKSIYSEYSVEENNLEELNKNKIDDKLEYIILNDGIIDYSQPIIYTDASTPISLEYMNNAIQTNEIISDTTQEVVYDGSLLRRAGVNLQDLAGSISFNITIINNLKQEFVATVNLNIPLEDSVTGKTIYDGKYVYKINAENLIKFYRIK